MTTSSPATRTFGSWLWIFWGIVGGTIGWAVGFFGFAMHCAVFIPGPIPMSADWQGMDKGVPVTAHIQIYGQTIHEETGPFGEVLDSSSRRAGWIAWPVVAVCIVAGALAGVWLWRRAQRRKLTAP